MVRLDVGPGNDPRIGDDEGLDRETAPRDFQRTVLGQQAALAAALDADQCPGRLLAGKSAWVGAAGRFACQGLEKCVRRSAKREILDLQLGQAIRPRRTIMEREAQKSRFRVGQQQRVGAAVAVDDPAHGSPVHAIVRELDVVP